MICKFWDVWVIICTYFSFDSADVTILANGTVKWNMMITVWYKACQNNIFYVLFALLTNFYQEFDLTGYIILGVKTCFEDYICLEMRTLSSVEYTTGTKLEMNVVYWI